MQLKVRGKKDKLIRNKIIILNRYCLLREEKGNEYIWNLGRNMAKNIGGMKKGTAIRRKIMYNKIRKK